MIRPADQRIGGRTSGRTAHKLILRTKQMRFLRAATALLLAGLAAAAAPARAPVQLSSSVMIFGDQDLDWPSMKTSMCGKQLRNAATHGSKSVNIVSPGTRRARPGRAPLQLGGHL